MMNQFLRKRPFWLSVLLLSAILSVSACGGPNDTEAEGALQAPTIVPTAVAGSNVTPTELPPPTTTPAPTATAVPEPSPAVASFAAPNAAAAYRVAYVTPQDMLNVRAGTGVSANVVGKLPPAADAVDITGAGQLVDGSTWLPIAAPGVSGWVNGRFLTGDVLAADFCRDEAVEALLAQLETAVAEEDGAALAELIHPERGLRIRESWWNPEVYITGDQIPTLFTADTSYEWGREDGSGFAITGSFAEIILPRLQQDLVGADETACNEIPHGATAGYVKLPPEYETVHHYAYYRTPDAGAHEFDWGTWAVGVEWWNGRYYLGYLVHYDYEI